MFCLYCHSAAIISILHFQENNAVFVMTNMVITPRQKQGKCPEDYEILDAQCDDDSNCTAGDEIISGHGMF